MTTLFEDEVLPGDLIVRLRDSYRDKLLSNPPTPAFMPDKPKREGAATWAAKRDVDRMLAVLDDLGLTIVPKEPESGSLESGSPDEQ